MSDHTKVAVMEGVKEYCEGYDVDLCIGEQSQPLYGKIPESDGSDGRWLVVAANEGGYNSTAIDIKQLVAWLRKNRPDLLEAE